MYFTALNCGSNCNDDDLTVSLFTYADVPEDFEPIVDPEDDPNSKDKAVKGAFKLFVSLMSVLSLLYASA